jgi:hypothetical protein
MNFRKENNMPTFDTIAYQQAGFQQNTIAANTNAQGTTETPVSLNANPFAAVAGISLGGGVIPLSVPATSGSLQGSNVASGLWSSARPFRVKANGTVTTGTTLNLTIKLYQVPASVLAAGTQATLANDNVLSSSGAIAVNSASANWELIAELQWDSTSKKLTGTAKWSLNGTLVAEAEITVVTTATASEGELNFILSQTFSASNTANTFQVQFFEILQA